MLQITICDPACGSGAFLNQALEFLIAEHQYIDELQAKLFGDTMVLREVENAILENNIYGVDINEESVEIAKLSLWLRTAQKGRKLTSLNDNIKCGNSLIDDPIVAGDKAFDWQKEFPEVFAKGGFDVVIGNPPWGAKLENKQEEFLLIKYPIVPSKLKDSYMYFMLLCIDVLKPNSYYGQIIPNTWLLINNTANFRRHLLGFEIIEIVDHGDGIFQDAVVESSSIFLKKKIEQDGKVIAKKFQKGQERINHIIEKKFWLEDELARIVLVSKAVDYSLIKKLESVSDRFDISSEIIFGIKPYQVGHGKPPQTRDVLKNRIFHSEVRIDDTWKPLVTGTNVNKYLCEYNNDAYIKYGQWLMYPSDQLKIEGKKILLRRTSADLRAVIDQNNYYPQNSLFIITSQYKLEYLSALLNSKLFDRIYKAKCPQVGKVFAEVKPSIIKSLPIKNPGEKIENKISELVSSIQNKWSEFASIRKHLTNLLQAKFSLEKLTKKIQNWTELNFGEFLKELEKARKKSTKENEAEYTKLSLSEEAEWMQYFTEQKQKAAELKAQIDKTDKEIDQMVYELYELTEEEIAIVENS